MGKGKKKSVRLEEVTKSSPRSDSSDVDCPFFKSEDQ